MNNEDYLKLIILICVSMIVIWTTFLLLPFLPWQLILILVLVAGTIACISFALVLTDLMKE